MPRKEIYTEYHREYNRLYLREWRKTQPPQKYNKEYYDKNKKDPHVALLTRERRKRHYLKICNNLEQYSHLLIRQKNNEKRRWRLKNYGEFFIAFDVLKNLAKEIRRNNGFCKW